MKLMFIMIKIGVPAVMAVCLSCCSGHTAGGGNELKCRVMEVEGGYGYVVLHGADTHDISTFYNRFERSPAICNKGGSAGGRSAGMP